MAILVARGSILTVTITETRLPDVKIIEPAKFGDDRGFFSEVFKKCDLSVAGVDFEPVQDNHSLSAEVGTVRGLHFQGPPSAQAKLVRVTRGAILDIAVDIRVGSPTFGQHVSVELSADNWRQVFVPKGFAHGFCTLQPNTEVLYKVDAYYDPTVDFGIAWDDPALSIDWRLEKTAPALSEKDKKHPVLSELKPVFSYKNGK